jgi:tetratricopeptide (TPR) repeat protein
MRRWLLLLCCAGATPAQSEWNQRVRDAVAASDFEQVLDIASQWIATLDDVAPTMDLATARTYRYIAQRNLGALGAAEDDARAVLELMTHLRGELAGDTITALGNLAGVRLLRGDLLSAEALYRECVSRLERVEGTPSADLARALNNLAVVLRRQGEWADAEGLYRRALESSVRAHGAEHRITALAQRNLAQTLFVQGQFEAARQALAAARLTYDGAADSLRLAATQFVRAELELAAGDANAAAAAAQEALALRERTLPESATEIANARVLVARVRAAAGDAPGAESLIQRSLVELQRVLGERHPDVVRAKVALGQAQLARGAARAAISTLEPAASAYELVLRSSAAGIDRASVDLPSPYPALAAAYLAADRPRDAWVAAELSHAKVLTELLDLALGKLPDELSTERARRSRRLEDLRSRLASMPPASAAFAPTRAELLAAESEWATFEQRIAVLQGVDRTQVVPLAQITALLREDELLVGWIDGWVWSLDAAGDLQWARCRQGSSARDLRELVLAARDAPAFAPPLEDASLRDAARRVGEEWFGALWPRLAGRSRLWLIPHGPLVGLPPALLRDAQGVAFVDRFDVVLLPSASVWQRAAAAPRQALSRSRALFFGGLPADAPTHARFARLPALFAATRELERCPKLLPASDLLVGARAREAALHQLAQNGRLSRYGLLHFSTHALSDAVRPGRSALMAIADPPATAWSAFVATAASDGALSAIEIADTWRLRAELVTLSACETALGREIAGEGYVGIAQSFLQAGARALLISQWAVDDEATSLLMEEFYRRWWRDGEDPAAALRSAQRHVRGLDAGRLSHPYYWAGFTLVGASPR